MVRYLRGISLRSKRFRRAKSEERGFRRFARAENGARAIAPFIANSLLSNRTEALATQASEVFNPPRPRVSAFQNGGSGRHFESIIAESLGPG